MKNSNSTDRKGFQKFIDVELKDKEDSKKQSKDAIVVKEEDNEDLDIIIDNLGFTRYHILIFIIAASILICGGVQELMLSIILSLITEQDQLTELHYAIITTCEYIGYALASIMVNVITNYLSNKKAIQIFTLMNLIFLGISILRLNFFLASCNRFVIGFCFGMIDILIYLNLVETCPTKIRGFIGSIILLFAPLGQFIIAVFCYFILPKNREIEDINYKSLLYVPYVTMAVILIGLLPFLKESARRLIALDKVDEGATVMKQISKFNRNKNFNANKGEEMIDRFIRKKTINLNQESEESNKNNEMDFKQLKKFNTFNISNDQLDKIRKLADSTKSKNNKQDNLLSESQANKYLSTDHEMNRNFIDGFLCLLNFKYKKFSIILWICAIFTNLIFNGIFFMLPTTAPTLNKATFKDVILSVSMEIVSSLVTCIAIENKRVGRLRSLKLGYFFSVLTCVVTFIVGSDYLIIMCLLKFFITIPTNVLLVYGSEIYDSKIRTFGVSFINFWKRSVTIISPFAVTYMEYSIGNIGPYFLFAPAAIICFCLTFFLNVETRGIPLDKIELNKNTTVGDKKNKENS
jgi:hypothetical protein